MEPKNRKEVLTTQVINLQDFIERSEGDYTPGKRQAVNEARQAIAKHEAELVELEAEETEQ